MSDTVYQGERPLSSDIDFGGQGQELARQVENRPQVMQDPPTSRPLPKQVRIEWLNHGFLVSVGCQNFAIETIDALLHRLNVYLKAPEETEKKWMAGEWKW